jgi:hypothetical protein
VQQFEVLTAHKPSDQRWVTKQQLQRYFSVCMDVRTRLEQELQAGILDGTGTSDRRTSTDQYSMQRQVEPLRGASFEVLWEQFRQGLPALPAPLFFSAACSYIESGEWSLVKRGGALHWRQQLKL